MKINIKILIFLILFLLPECMMAQFNMLFTSDHELPNTLVNKIVEDRDGIIWIATEDGLCRYNGSSFVTYYSDRSNRNSLQDNFVRSVCADSKGNLVVGTTVGVQLYRKRTNDFTPIVVDMDKGIRPSNVNYICLLKNGDYIIAGEQTYTLHIEDDGTPVAKPNVLTKKQGDIHCVTEDAKGNLWVLFHGNGVMKVDKKGRFTTVRDENSHGYDFSEFCTGNDGKLYAGSNIRGLYEYNEKTGHFDLIPGTEQIHKVRDMKKIPDSNTICVATDGWGVSFFDCATKSFVSSRKFDDPFVDISSQKVHSLFISKYGDIWMALYQKGVFMYSSAAVPFLYIGSRSHWNDLIGDRCVTSILQTRSGQIWTATDNGGLYGFTPDLKSIQKFKCSPAADGVPSTTIGLFEDSKGRVWFGSFARGCGIVNLSTGKCSYIPLEGTDNRQFNVYAYAEDKRGQIWAASMGNGLLKYNEKTRKMETYCQSSTLWSSSIFYDKSNDMLYVGTYNGVVKISPSDKSKKLTLVVPFTILNAISRVNANTLAFSTNKGLILYDTKKGKETYVTMKEGLPSNTIYAAESDRIGGVWISSVCGLTRLDLATMALETYTMRDGLQGNEFYKNASMVSRDGRLWFGGINGITAFSPVEIKKPRKPCYTRVVGIRTGLHSLLPNDGNDFILTDDEHSFTIELATFPLYMTHRVAYSYKVDNGEWESLPVSMNHVSFSNLSSGSHTVYTKTTLDGQDSEVVKTRIYIEYPWYMSWWAWILWLSILMALTYFAIIEMRRRHAIKVKMEKNKRENEINEGKLQFFMNLVHDLRTPITLIYTPLQKLRKMDSDSERGRLYGIIDRNVDRLLRLTDQIMDLRKIDRGKMAIQCTEVEVGTLVSNIVTSVKDLADSRRITLSVNNETAANLRMWLDIDGFEKILLNLLSNALKYTSEDGKVDVFIRENEPTDDFPQGALQLSVVDNGIGIPDEEKENIFKRFYQVRRSGNHIKGTGIGLNLVKAIVELHHGQIFVADNPYESGTCFSVLFPLGKDLYSEEELSDKEYVEIKSVPEPAAVVVDVDESQKNSPSTRKTILVVDDDDEIRSFLCEELAGLYNIVDCSDGKSAYEILTRENIDMVISDIMMPEVDGIELCKRIRRNVRISHLPVILLTAKSSDQDRIEGLQTKADAYVTKPFNLELLLTIISNLFYRHDSVRNTFSGNTMPSEQVDTPQIQSSDERLLEKLINYINENLSNPDLTSDDLAREAGLSRTHLYRKLKELTNQSATNYIRNIRLMKAAELLRQNKMNISEVAYSVGFRTPKHFATTFKELYGMTPTEYMTNDDAKSGE